MCFSGRGDWVSLLYDEALLSLATLCCAGHSCSCGLEKDDPRVDGEYPQ